MWHWGLQVIIVCSNDEPGLTLTYFTARSNFLHLACPVNTSQLNEELKRNVTAQQQLSSDPLEVCSDNDVAC